jgi:hypothetical protein
MVDILKTLREIVELGGQVADRVKSIAVNVTKSEEFEAIRDKAAEEIEAIKEKAAEEIEAIKEKTSNAIEDVLSTGQRTLYTEAAEACEGVNDALLREERGTTAKMTKVATAKLGAIGTSAGIFGLAATVGTSGTGTAIGVLSGAAATSATLAWVGGSVAMGTAIVGTVAVAGGIGFAAGALWGFHKYWRGKKRLQEELSEREQRITEVTSKLAVACRRMENDGRDPAPQVARVIFKETLDPLCEELMEQEGGYADWPRGAMNRLKSAVSRLNDIVMRMKHLGNKSPTITIAVFATVITKLLQSDISELTADQELVLEALRRSRNDLENASDKELVEYVNSLSEVQLDGAINNVKGIYHEMLFVAAENSDGDVYSAAMFEETNHPGADVLITNELTGETQAVQLKATQYRSYIREHKERYAEFEIFATEEVAGDGVSSTGYSNEQVTGDTEDTMSILRDSGGGVVGDAMATSAMIALAFQLGRVIKSRDISEAKAREATVEVTKTAFLSGLIAWAID